MHLGFIDPRIDEMIPLKSTIPLDGSERNCAEGKFDQNSPAKRGCSRQSVGKSGSGNVRRNMQAALDCIAANDLMDDQVVVRSYDVRKLELIQQTKEWTSRWIWPSGVVAQL